jgi:putative hemolysin
LLKKNLSAELELDIRSVHAMPLGIRSAVQESILKRILLIERFSKLFPEALAPGDDRHVADRMLSALNITYEMSEIDYTRIPKNGALIVVANHPFGAVEGLILSSILSSVRADARILANYLLRTLNIPEFEDLFFYVDPFGRKDSIRSNIKPMREAMHWVESGGVLGVFPSGEVSHLRLLKREISDPKWSNSIARIIRKTKAPVLPFFFEGANSKLFQLLGLVHPLLRTLMLPREMLNKRNKVVGVRVGKLVTFDKLSRFQEDDSMMEYLRLRTYMLGKRGEDSTKKRRGIIRRTTAPNNSGQPIALPQPPNLLIDEVRNIPAEQVLVETDRYTVFQAGAESIPNLLQEMGRLREITFRDAGEGTGKSVDIDRFDEYYIHLLLWDKESDEVAGGYRLGLTDDILQMHGRRGLYTSTLFEYTRAFLDRIQPAIELGRSFVRPEYQKSYHPLMLLWKGIGRYVALNPQYKTLIGPVSISNNYLSVSRELIAAFYRKSSGQRGSTDMVKSNNPLRYKLKSGRNLKAACTLLHDIQDVSEVISDIETDQKGIPILLKHYMKLGGDILGLTIDHNFSDVMDVLILVDLTRTDPKILERYMGKEATGAFLRYHGGGSLAHCA